MGAGVACSIAGGGAGAGGSSRADAAGVGATGAAAMTCVVSSKAGADVGGAPSRVDSPARSGRVCDDSDGGGAVGGDAPDVEAAMSTREEDVARGGGWTSK